MEEELISIDQNGIISFIYDDSLLDFINLGSTTIQRASHVEPEGTEWYAQMINGPKLGPFKTRAEALSSEREYLEKEMFSV